MPISLHSSPPYWFHSHKKRCKPPFFRFSFCSSDYLDFKKKGKKRTYKKKKKKKKRFVSLAWTLSVYVLLCRNCSCQWPYGEGKKKKNACQILEQWRHAIQNHKKDISPLLIGCGVMSHDGCHWAITCFFFFGASLFFVYIFSWFSTFNSFYRFTNSSFQIMNVVGFGWVSFKISYRFLVVLFSLEAHEYSLFLLFFFFYTFFFFLSFLDLALDFLCHIVCQETSLVVCLWRLPSWWYFLFHIGLHVYEQIQIICCIFL